MLGVDRFLVKDTQLTHHRLKIYFPMFTMLVNFSFGILSRYLHVCIVYITITYTAAQTLSSRNTCLAAFYTTLHDTTAWTYIWLKRLTCKFCGVVALRSEIACAVLYCFLRLVSKFVDLMHMKCVIRMVRWGKYVGKTWPNTKKLTTKSIIMVLIRKVLISYALFAVLSYKKCTHI